MFRKVNDVDHARKGLTRIGSTICDGSLADCQGWDGQDHGCGRLQSSLGVDPEWLPNLVDSSAVGSFMTRRPVRSTQMKRS